MVKLNQTYTVNIEALSDNGYGVAHVGKDMIYVKHALPKESGKVKITKKLKQGYVGEMLTWNKQAQGRQKSPCGIYQRCGSCHLLHTDYETELHLKKEMVEGWLKSSALRLKVHDVIGMKEPYAYRNKIIVGFQKDRNRNIQAGFYEEFSHRIVPFTHCLLHDEGMDRIIQSIVKLMEKFRIEPYDEDRRRGLLRHVVLRKGVVSGEIMVVLVVASQTFPARKNFVSALRLQHPEITTIVQNVNTRKTSVVLGDDERVLFGKGYIEDTLCGNVYQISSKSFYQINHNQCEVLYEAALSLLELKGNEVLLDTYCGIGTIGMSASAKVKQVIGVESNQKAVKDAILNAKRNRINNIRFVCKDASAFITQAAAKKERMDVIIMDPPRSGSTKEFMDACAKIRPKQIVYISCDPKTQIRDLEYFKRLGYHASDMMLVDMFPHTMHVEGVCLLSKIKFN